MVDVSLDVTTIEIDERTTQEDITGVVTGSLTALNGVTIVPSKSGIINTTDPSTTRFYDVLVSTSGSSSGVPIIVKRRTLSAENLVPENIITTDPFELVTFIQDVPATAQFHVFARQDLSGRLMYDLFWTFTGAAGTTDYTLDIVSAPVPQGDSFLNPLETPTNAPTFQRSVLRHVNGQAVYDFFVLSVD